MLTDIGDTERLVEEVSSMGSVEVTMETKYAALFAKRRVHRAPHRQSDVEPS